MPLTRPCQRVKQRSLQQLQPLKGRRGGKDQNRSGQKGQRTGKVQKQHRPHASAQQGDDPSCPWPTGRHAPQGKGRVIPRRLGGGQRRRQKKSDAPGQQLCRPGAAADVPAGAGSISCPCAPQLVPPVFRREVHGLFGFFHYFTGCVEKIPSGKESRAISGLDAHSGLLRPDMV